MRINFAMLLALLNIANANKFIAVGRSHACAIGQPTGKAYCWGRNDAGQLGINTTISVNEPTQVLNLMGAKSVCATQGRIGITCFVTSINTVMCTGNGNDD